MYSWGTMAHSCLHPLLLARAEPLEGPEESSNLEQEESLSITGSKDHVLGEGTETCPKVHRISVSLLGSESDVPTSTEALFITLCYENQSKAGLPESRSQLRGVRH